LLNYPTKTIRFSGSLGLKSNSSAIPVSHKVSRVSLGKSFSLTVSVFLWLPLYLKLKPGLDLG